MKKAQSSMEYMTIVGFVLVALTLIVSASMYYQRNMSDQILLNQIDALGKRIVLNANEVYGFGSATQLTLNAEIPSHVEGINFSGKEIVFTYRTQSGTSTVGYSADINLTGAISPEEGMRKIIVQARDGYVWINGTT